MVLARGGGGGTGPKAGAVKRSALAGAPAALARQLTVNVMPVSSYMPVVPGGARAPSGRSWPGPATLNVDQRKRCNGASGYRPPSNSRS